MPGTESGSMTRRKTCTVVAAEVLRGLDEPGVDLHDDGVQRHYHVRQVVVHHAEDDAAPSLRMSGSGPMPIGARKVLMMPVSSQQRDPRQRAQQEAHAHREHNEHVEEPLRQRLALRDKICDGVADDEADERGRRARSQIERRKIGQVLPQRGEVRKRKFAGGCVGEARSRRRSPAGRS